MSWITFIWSLTAGICLTLGAVHIVIWSRRRDQWAYLVFSLSALAAACYAVLDMVALRTRTPDEYGALWRWALSLGMIEGVMIALFVRLHLRAGRLWLLGLLCGVRALMLVLNFVPGPNFYFREITSLQQVPLLGETISRPQGELHPWAVLMLPSLLLIILFAVDAAHTAAKRGDRRRAWVLGSLMAGGYSLVIVSYSLYARGTLPSTFSSQLFLLLILFMGYELSLDVLRAGDLSRSLQQSEERFTLAAQSANVGIWSRDLASDDIWASDKWREMFGFTMSERLDVERFMQRLHPDDRDTVRHAVAKAVQQTESYEIEYRVVRPDGQTRWISSHGGVELDAGGKPVRVRGVSVDITARKQLEAETLRQQTELAHMARVSTMGQLASTLAHELNQPLGAILRNAEAGAMILDHPTPDLEEIRAIFDDICKDNQRAGAVIDRTRAMLERRPIVSARLDMNVLVAGVAALIRADAVKRGVALQVESASGLPPLRGDHVQLQQVLLNLMINGMDAMNDVPLGERRLVVRTRLGDDRMIEVSVSDTGHGIPPDRLTLMFQPFFTTKPNGLGMGLAISRSIVGAHSGRLWAENNPDRGATLRLTLPAAQESAPT